MELSEWTAASEVLPPLPLRVPWCPVSQFSALVVVSQTKGLYRGCWTRPKQSLAAPCPLKATANTLNLSKDSAIMRDCTVHTKGAFCFICCPQIGTADDLKLDIHCLFVRIFYAKQLASWCILAEKHTLKLFFAMGNVQFTHYTFLFLYSTFIHVLMHKCMCFEHDRVQG